jgi:excinuclease ABC subunit C
MNIDDNFSEMIKNAPRTPGVYRMFDAMGNLLYVGKAKNLILRLRQYRDAEKLEYHKIIMRRQVARVEWESVPTEAIALILEQRLIKTLDPKYNVILKDDKMYPYLRLTREKFPRLEKFREKIVKAGRSVYGPFPFVSDLNDTIKLLQRVAGIRTCAPAVFTAHSRSGRPCILGQTGRCAAPCSMSNEQCAMSNYGYCVKVAKNILNGHIRLVVSDLNKKMKAASAARDFETAAKIRGQIESLQSVAKIGKIGKSGQGLGSGVSEAR